MAEYCTPPQDARLFTDAPAGAGASNPTGSDVGCAARDARLTAQLGRLLGMLAFGALADRFGRRVLFTAYSLLTAASLYPLAFHWHQLLEQPVLFWGVLFGLGLGSGCTAGFGALLAELFPTDIRNFSMGTTYNLARGVQFFAPVVVNQFVVMYGLSGGLSVPLVLALATATWVWTLPETRVRDLAAIPSAAAGA
jgi:MFS family permease